MEKQKLPLLDDFVAAADITNPDQKLKDKDLEKARLISEFVCSRTKTHHVYTDSINQKGRSIQERMETYLSNENYLSSSLFKYPNLQAYNFRRSEIAKKLQALRPDSPALSKGADIHMAVLEKSSFDRLIIEPKESRASTIGVNNLIKFYEDEIEKRF